MRFVALHDVVKPVRTWNPRSEASGEITYIELSSVSRELKRIVAPMSVISWEAPSRARQLIATDDVLVSTVRPNLNAVAHIPPELDGATASTGFTVLRSDQEHILSRYLFHWVRTPQFIGEMVRLSTGASYPAVTDRIVKSSAIPLPPLTEQRRIAATMDTADELRQIRRDSIEKLDELRLSIFTAMFGDPISNPCGWEVAEFSSQFNGIRYGTGSPPPYVESGVPFVRATDIKRGRVVLNGMKAISLVDARNLEKCRLSTGDMIIVRSGVNTGDCALVPESLDGACAAYDMIVSLPSDSGTFYQFLLDSVFGKRVLAPLKRRAAQPHLNARQISTLRLIAPPRSLRREFHTRMKAVEQEYQAQGEHRGHLERLFGSLQQQAFSGGL